MPQFKCFPYNVPVSSRYGAPMGRMDVGGAGGDDYVKLRLRRVRLVDGVYDGGGAYWGSRPRGSTLFCIWSADRAIILYRDACNYLFAQEAARELYPQADFL